MAHVSSRGCYRCSLPVARTTTRVDPSFAALCASSHIRTQYSLSLCLSVRILSLFFSLQQPSPPPSYAVTCCLCVAVCLPRCQRREGEAASVVGAREGREREKMRVRMSTNGINNNGNNSNGSSMEDMSGMMTCSSSSPSPTDIRIERETASSFACGVSSVSSMSAEYTFSSAFRFGSKVWKLGAKRLKDVYSFLIYPMDVDDTSHEEGYSVQMVIVSPDESEDHILVQGRREFNNNATIFVWTASFTSLRPFLQHDTIFISFDMKTLSPGHIFSTDAELDFRDNIRQSAKDQVMDKATGVFPIILTGIRDISLNGISSPSFAFEGNQWELKMCQNGNLYAFRIMCNRKIGQRFSVCAKIQLSVHASPVPAAVTTAATGNTGSSEPVAGTGFRTIHVEGSRRFRDSDDSMFWSFDKRLDKYVNDDALAVEMKITVYRPRDKNDLPASQV